MAGNLLYLTDSTAVPFPNSTQGSANGPATAIANILLSFNAGDEGSGTPAFTVQISSTKVAVVLQTPVGSLTGLGNARGLWTFRINLTQSSGTMQLDGVTVAVLNRVGTVTTNLISVSGLGAVLPINTTFTLSSVALAGFNGDDTLSILLSVVNTSGSAAGNGTVATNTYFDTKLQPNTGPFFADDGLVCEPGQYYG